MCLAPNEQCSKTASRWRRGDKMGSTFFSDFLCNKELGFGRNALFGELRWVLSISFVKTDEAQSPRVPVPFLKDPYEAIRQAYLVETKTPESPYTVALPTLLPDSIPPTHHAKDSVDSNTSGARSTPSDSTAPLSPDHLLTHALPTLVPSIRRTARMAVRVPPAMSPGLSASIAYVAAIVESLGLGEDAAILEGQQRVAPVMETAMGERLGLSYGALRRYEIALGEGRMPSVFEVGRPRGPPVQTPPSPEWSSGLLPVSLAPSIVPSPISSPMIPLTIPSPVASPATTETEGFLTELGA
ncbi:hypothetical protein Tco_1021328 [Tanacetum coccineum]